MTVRLIVVVWLSEPEVPVTVTVVGPGVAPALAVSVSTLVPAVLAGLNEAVTPLGRPDAARLTLPLKPPTGATLSVLVLLLPWVRLRLAGDADSE